MPRPRFVPLRWMLSLALLPLSSAMAADAKLQDKDIVAICGDSITEQKLYSVYIEDYLLMCRPVTGARTVQVGWSGETAPGFLKRMDQDALSFHPTVATTCYGMNDGAYAAYKDETGKRYRDSMTDIVKKLKTGGVRTIVVGSPGMVDPAYFPPSYINKRFSDLPREQYATVYNQTLAKLRDIAKEVAAEQGVTYADVYDAMNDVMTKAKAKYGEKYHVAGADGVHPAPNGHIVMAYAFLKALGCDGNIGTITLDMSTGTANATDGHKILSASTTQVEVESSRYPFCFSGDPQDPASTTGIIEFIPFNQDLNRFTLILKNSPEKVKVTWGNTSKEFTREQAQTGINLAAEFLNNPFSQPFQTIESTIKKQQLFETAITKTLFHLPPSSVAGKEEGFNALVNGALHEDQQLALTSSSITPLKHLIKVEPLK